MLNNPLEKEYVIRFIDDAIKKTDDDGEVLINVQRSLVRAIAEKFMPLYKSSKGHEGFESLYQAFNEPYTIYRSSSA